ncbi:MAG TPA: patatin-like phospholipase family protein [Dehalococcoidia bacterium]|nr:patatin-like phospholipase family protein [Dehalococcoidia bacterium]
MRRALVLGGGGAVGIAWETGICAGLLAGGVDVREADVIVGTSAGSVVGTSLAHGSDPRDLFEEQRRPREAPPAVPGRDMAEVAAIFRLWTSFDDMTEAACKEVGAAAVSASTVPEEQWLATFASRGWPGWPAKPLLVTAVDCATGAFKAFDAQSAVPIVHAVTASCSVPGLAPPVTIDGRRYMDGGVRSGTSADLAQRIEPDVVLIVAPMGRRDGGVDRLAAKQLAREMGELEAAGVGVHLVQFDDVTKQLVGQNLMNPASAPPAAEAGLAHGQRLAVDLRRWWRQPR